MEVELTIFDPTLPVNTLCILKRLEEILRENGTNSLLGLKGEALARAKACILILIEHAMMDWDIPMEWEKVRKELKPCLIASKLTK